MFGRKLPKDLSDPRKRRALLEEIIAEARDLYRQRQTEEAREPILELQDAYDEAGIDRLELLYAAESALPSDGYWLDAIVEILLRKDFLGTDEVPYLLRQAMRHPERLRLWQRLLTSCQRRGDDVMAFQVRQQLVIALQQYFPKPGETYWVDHLTEGEASKLFSESLEAAVEGIIATRSQDAAARDLLRLASHYYPDNDDVTLFLARAICRENKRDVHSLTTVLRALEIAPDDTVMRRWAANVLVALPGHFREGLALLRDLHATHPGDGDTARDLVHALKELDVIEGDDLRLIEEYVAANPDDLRALEMLADYFASRDDLSDNALQVYRKAASHSHQRKLYLKMLGKASASRGHWSEVIELFDEASDGVPESEDIVLPLATAYAEFDRRDPAALKIYALALQFGTKKPEVHDIYCAHLYRHAPQAPESIAQFKQSVATHPGCLWSRLGMAAHYLRTGDFGHALDEAAVLLSSRPEDHEAGLIGAEALARDYSRKQLAKLAHLPARAMRGIFEGAYKLQPDATPIAVGLARRRIADGVKDHDTIKLLGEVSRRNPDAIDLRIARADMLWDIGERENGVSLYRELLERWRASAVGGPGRASDTDTRHRILKRVAEFLMVPPGPAEADVDIMLEALALPDVAPEMVLSAARLLVDQRIDHPHRTLLIERALRLAPGDLKLERALAEGFAATGDAGPAVKLATRLLRNKESVEEAGSLLRGASAVAELPFLDNGDLEEFRHAVADGSLPSEVLLPAMELLSIHDVRAPGNIPILEQLAGQLPRNTKVKRWLGMALSSSGEHLVRAADIFGDLVDEAPNDDELVLSLARTHAQLGRHQPGDLRLAQRAVELAPEDTELLLHLAAIELAMSSHRPAARHLDRALGLNPDLHPRVLSIIERSAQVSTRHSHLLLLLARVHIKAGRVEQALMTLGRLQRNYQDHLGDMISCYGEILEHEPENSRAFMERGMLFRLSGQSDEAVADMEKAHSLAPHNTDIMSEYVDALSQKINAEGSGADLALMNKVAFLHSQLGREDEAVMLVGRVLERDPQNIGAVRLLAHLQLENGELDGAWETLRGLADREPALDLFQRLAHAFDEQEDHLRAAEVLTDAIEFGGAQRELLEQLRNLHTEQAKVARNAPARNRLLGELSDRAQGRYELREELGSGAMGVVYKTYDRELDEIVVLKILPEHFARNPEALRRFRNEAKAARKLAHPNIVRIHDIGEEGGRKHISMEYVAGGDLRTWMLRNPGPMPTDRCITLLREIARALTHAHDMGVLHRDIKSANILLTPTGRVKLSDFGIAALLEVASTDLDGTGTSTVMGTPLYMSPEQFEGAQLTAASDLYSVGVLFYELLSGDPPFTKGSISYHHQFTPPPMITVIPDKLWRIVEKLLEKDPRMRFQSARELLAELDFWEGRTGTRQGLTSSGDITRMPTPVDAADDLSRMKTPLIGHGEIPEFEM